MDIKIIKVSFIECNQSIIWIELFVVIYCIVEIAGVINTTYLNSNIK